MTIEIVTPPAIEPVSLAEAKLRLRVDHDDEDALIAAMITAARERVEALSGRALITRRLRERRDDWSAGGRLTAHGAQFRLSLGPISAVHHVKTYDEDGSETTFDAASYYVDTRSVPGRLALLGGACWPRPGRGADGIEIEFDAGYGLTAADPPRPLIEAVELLVAEAYEFRAPGDPGAAPPLVVQAIVAPFARARL